MILAVFRIGAHIPAPFVDRANLAKAVEAAQNSAAGGLLAMVDMFSGNAFRHMSVLALGIMPYISVSIILQLLAVVYPRLQKIQQEGALGQRKITRLTRQLTIVLALFQALAVALTLHRQDLAQHYFSEGLMFGVFVFAIMISLTAGTAFLMWLGERITEDGIGNGISLIIGVGIMSGYPSSALSLWEGFQTGTINWAWGGLVVVLFVISTLCIIIIQEGTRRIPMQHAKRVVGRKMMSGGSNYLPLKVNSANVIPVIFASAILAFPAFIAGILPGGENGAGRWMNIFNLKSNANLYDALGLESRGGFDLALILKSINPHIILFSLLVAFFCFFYTLVTFRPDEIANNLKKSGSFVPGKRPGKPTADYIEYVLLRITAFGALFLVLIAIIPMVLTVSFNMPDAAHAFVGGTSLIIVIGVILDLLKQVEAQLLMRNYEGFTSRRNSNRWK